MLLHTLKIAFKVLLRRKVFTAISLFGISLTLAVLIVAAAFLDHGLGAQPYEPHVDRTAGMFYMQLEGNQNTSNGSPGYAFLEGYVLPLAKVPGVEAVTAFGTGQRITTFRDGARIDLDLRRTDAAFWTFFTPRFLEGAPYSVDDAEAGRPVAVINRATRERHFDDQPALGRRLEIDGQNFEIVGVVDNLPRMRPVEGVDVWTPLASAPSETWRRGYRGGFQALVRVEERRHLAAARAELASSLVGVELPEPFETLEAHLETYPELAARTLTDGRVPRRHEVWVLRLTIILGAILFMVLPSINLINLNTSRILERASEIGVRKSFGAPTRTLVGQFVVENMVLALCGGLIGLLAAFVVLEMVAGSTLLPYALFPLNLRIVAWGLVLTLAFGILSGAWPAWRMARLHPVAALGGRS